MNSQYMTQPTELRLSLDKSIPVIPYGRTFIWLAFCTLGGYTIASMPKQVLTFFQKPLGIFIVVFGLIYSSVDFNTSPNTLIKMIISSLIYTIILYGIIKTVNLLFEEEEE